MDIKRNINGIDVTITLTDKEVERAHRQWEEQETTRKAANYLAHYYGIVSDPDFEPEGDVDVRKMPGRDMIGTGLTDFVSEWGFTFYEAIRPTSKRYLLGSLVNKYWQINNDAAPQMEIWQDAITALQMEQRQPAGKLTPKELRLVKLADVVREQPYPWDKYTVELCPHCNTEVVINALGVTACPHCGKPVAPCSVCYDADTSCTDECPYAENDKEITEITAFPVTREEMDEILAMKEEK